MNRFRMIFFLLILSSTADAQFLKEIDVGLSLRSTTHLTQMYRDLYSPDSHLNLSVHTPFHVGHLQGNIRYFKSNAIPEDSEDYTQLNAELFWLAGVPLSPSLRIFAGIGTGAEIYFIDSWGGSTMETEVLFALKSELQYTWRNLILFSDVTLTRVHIYYKMEYISFGAGLRYRFRPSQEVLNAIR